MKQWRTILMIIVDMFIVNMGYLFAINITKAGEFTEIATIYSKDCVVVSLIYLICFIVCRLYHSLWDLTGTDEFLMSVGGCIFAGLLSIGYTRLLGSMIPINVCVIGILIVTVSIIGLRILYRVYRRILLYMPFKDYVDQKRVMIVGAGSAGNMIINEMHSRREMKYNPILLIDDSEYKQGKRISGIVVKGKRTDIPQLAIDNNIDLIIIAIPTLDNNNKRDIIDICKKTNCKLQIIPGIYEIIQGDATIARIKDVELEDLLGRDPVELDTRGIQNYISEKVVLVTGGGGSIGSELCRQIAMFKPKELIIFDIYENNAYEIQNELRYNHPELKLKTLIGSVRDEDRLKEIFDANDINVVFHAAAHKHVPLMEDSPKEAIKNNVFGTMKLSKEAAIHNVDRFVLISTDKAVNPTNIMGATKRLCEMIVQAMDKSYKTEFVAVRFGNVLGSNGSVIPLFKNQINKGGPITVTHKDITRYFMLIPEAAQLVLQAGVFAKGGEIFVLDMGKPVKIYDLACDLIKLSGFEPNVDIKIEISGLRPGEKLYEELLMSEEGLTNTIHNKIYIGKPTFTSMQELESKLNELQGLLSADNIEEVKNKMEQIVPTYKRVDKY